MRFKLCALNSFWVCLIPFILAASLQAADVRFRLQAGAFVPTGRLVREYLNYPVCVGMYGEELSVTFPKHRDFGFFLGIQRNFPYRVDYEYGGRSRYESYRKSFYALGLEKLFQGKRYYVSGRIGTSYDWDYFLLYHWTGWQMKSGLLLACAAAYELTPVLSVFAQAEYIHEKIENDWGVSNGYSRFQDYFNGRAYNVGGLILSGGIEYFVDSPLLNAPDQPSWKGLRIGFEVNPLLPLWEMREDRPAFSGALSVFCMDKKLSMTIPFSYRATESRRWFADNHGNGKVISLGSRLRYLRNDDSPGTGYFEAGFDYQYGVPNSYGDSTTGRSSFYRVGPGVGLGVVVQLDERLYWDFGAFVCWYLWGYWDKESMRLKEFPRISGNPAYHIRLMQIGYVF